MLNILLSLFFLTAQELPRYVNISASSDRVEQSNNKDKTILFTKSFNEDPSNIIANAQVKNIYESVSLLLDIIEKPSEKVLNIAVFIEDKSKAITGLCSIYYKLNMYPYLLRERSLKALREITLDRSYADGIRELSTFTYALLGQNDIVSELEFLAKGELVGDDFKKAVLGIKGLTYIYSKASTEAIIRVLNSSIGGNADFYGFLDEKGKFTSLSNNPIPRLALLALAARGVNPTASIFSSLEFLGKEIGSHGRVAREAVINYTAKHKGFEDIRKAMVDARIEDFGKHMVYILGNIYVFAMSMGMGWVAEAKDIAKISAERLINTSYNQAGTIRLINTLESEKTMAAARQVGAVVGRDMPIQVGLDMPLAGRAPYIEPVNPSPYYPEGLPLAPEVIEPFYLRGGTAVLTKPTLVKPLIQEGLAPAYMARPSIVPVTNSLKPQPLNYLNPIDAKPISINPAINNNFTNPALTASILNTVNINNINTDNESTVNSLDISSSLLKQFKPMTKSVGGKTYVKEGFFWYVIDDPYKRPYAFDKSNDVMISLLSPISPIFNTQASSSESKKAKEPDSLSIKNFLSTLSQNNNTTLVKHVKTVLNPILKLEKYIYLYEQLDKYFNLKKNTDLSDKIGLILTNNINNESKLTIELDNILKTEEKSYKKFINNLRVQSYIEYLVSLKSIDDSAVKSIGAVVYEALRKNDPFDSRSIDIIKNRINAIIKSFDEKTKMFIEDQFNYYFINREVSDVLRLYLKDPMPPSTDQVIESYGKLRRDYLDYILNTKIGEATLFELLSYNYMLTITKQRGSYNVGDFDFGDSYSGYGSYDIFTMPSDISKKMTITHNYHPMYPIVRFNSYFDFFKEYNGDLKTINLINSLYKDIDIFNKQYQNTFNEMIINYINSLVSFYKTKLKNSNNSIDFFNAFYVYIKNNFPNIFKDQVIKNEIEKIFSDYIWQTGEPLIVSFKEHDLFILNNNNFYQNLREPIYEFNKTVVSLGSFEDKMFEIKKTYQNILDSILKGKTYNPSDLKALKDYLAYFTSISNVTDFKTTFSLSNAPDLNSDVEYEFQSLIQTLIFTSTNNINEAVLTLNDYFRTLHPNFDSEVNSVYNFLKDIIFDFMFADRDGTIAKYCARYATAIQDPSSAFFLYNFIKNRISELAVILTSAPLYGVEIPGILSPGLLDLSLIFKDGIDSKYSVAGSAGTQFIHNGKSYTYPIEEADIKLLDEFYEALIELINSDERYKIFLSIGSKVQKKLGQITVARQDFAGSVDPALSNEFLEKVRSLAKTIGNGRLNLNSDPKLDIEIILHHWTKAAGVVNIEFNLKIPLENQKILGSFVLKWKPFRLV